MDFRKLLVLDLDETLIHARSERLDQEEAFRVFGYYVYVRPHVERFLIDCATHFRLAVWSSASDGYVEEIVRRVFPPEIPLEFVWGRSRCTLSFDYKRFAVDGHVDAFSHYHHVKKLHKLKRKGYRLEHVLIVDDSPEKCIHNYGNAIYVREYGGEQYDEELLHLRDYLVTLKDAVNVRTIEKRTWRKTVGGK
jgi:RNA polymerase II subunit A small phosphatase-like protein